MRIWKQRARSRQREQMLRDNIGYKQNLREMDRNERSMLKLIRQYEDMAVQEEKAGHHSRAVSMAAEAARLKKHQSMTGSIRTSLEVAHAVQSTNQAMKDIMEVSRQSAGSLMAEAKSPDACAMQTELCIMQEQVHAMMEQRELMCENLEPAGSGMDDEEGERYLKALLSSAGKDRQMKLLRDTNSRLEMLQRNRNSEHEGSK